MIHFRISIQLSDIAGHKIHLIELELLVLLLGGATTLGVFF